MAKTERQIKSVKKKISKQKKAEKKPAKKVAKKKAMSQEFICALTRENWHLRIANGKLVKFIMDKNNLTHEQVCKELETWDAEQKKKFEAENPAPTPAPEQQC